MGVYYDLTRKCNSKMASLKLEILIPQLVDKVSTKCIDGVTVRYTITQLATLNWANVILMYCQRLDFGQYETLAGCIWWNTGHCYLPNVRWANVSRLTYVGTMFYVLRRYDVGMTYCQRWPIVLDILPTYNYVYPQFNPWQSSIVMHFPPTRRHHSKS